MTADQGKPGHCVANTVRPPAVYASAVQAGSFPGGCQHSPQVGGRCGRSGNMQLKGIRAEPQAHIDGCVRRVLQGQQEVLHNAVAG